MSFPKEQMRVVVWVCFFIVILTGLSSVNIVSPQWDERVNAWTAEGGSVVWDESLQRWIDETGDLYFDDIALRWIRKSDNFWWDSKKGMYVDKHNNYFDEKRGVWVRADELAYWREESKSWVALRPFDYYWNEKNGHWRVVPGYWDESMENSKQPDGSYWDPALQGWIDSSEEYYFDSKDMNWKPLD